ncbi:MAG: AAA family ATPase [Planctomycetota bacterium]
MYSDETIHALTEALGFSPENTTLRGQVAEMLMGRGRLQEAEEMLRDGLKRSPGHLGLGLAMGECLLRLERRPEAVVVLESLVGPAGSDAAALVQLAGLLLRAGERDSASLVYRRAVREDPGRAEPKLGKELGVVPNQESDEPDQPEDLPFDDALDDEEWDEAAGRVRVRADHSPSGSPIEMERPSMGFDDVGGMQGLKEEVRLKIIEPIRNADLYKAYGKSIGGGILMYGPPGCGKTHLARATAGQIDAGFLAVGIHDVLEMWLGQSEQKLHALFDYARANTPCVLFFDEVDALGMKRSAVGGSGGRNVINQLLSELDGVRDRNDGVLILAATNAPWDLDAALRRPGRFDRVIFVPPPDTAGAAAILRLHLQGKPQEAIDVSTVAAKCSGFSGADLKAVVDRAVEAKLSDALKTGTPEPITTRDLVKAARKTRASTREWFATAKNHALYSNDSGHYDDILDYLKIKR